MKRFICAACVFLLVFSITACSGYSKTNMPVPSRDIASSSDPSGEKESSITAEIVKSGTVNTSYSYEKCSVELVSWDLGYSGHVLTKGAEVLCIKFHVKNESDEQCTIQDVFYPKVFLDGVEASVFGSDFYGDNRSFNVFMDSELRAGAETDIYLCLDCNISESHKIEVDLMELGDEMGITVVTDEVLNTFSFDIE